ncbi:MAG: hypothetical protein JSS49_09330 [Planctomycetes bacterium]|nr:hypothetical protein [Planctomycetota bacterium]
MESKKFLNIDEVAAEFGLDAASLKPFVDSGEVRALADRGTWKYRRDELQALVDAGKIEPVGSLSDGDQILTFHNPGEAQDDDLSYIELDEEALAEQATMITKSSPLESPPQSAAEQDWFVPSDAGEMTAPSEQSSSDVKVYSGPADISGELPAMIDESDSDVRIAETFDSPKAEDSGILLDFNLDAGATVSSAGSSLRLPQTAPGPNEDEVPDVGDETAWDDVSDVGETGSSVVGISAGESGIMPGDEEGSSVGVGGDSGVQLVDLSGSGVRIQAEESGILLGDDSHLGMAGGSSVLASAAGDVSDSGIALESAQEDSGITLDDSGITLDSGRPDSGITLAGDSGIALGGMDSGLSLEAAADSGLSLQGAGDSGITIDSNAQTQADSDLEMNLDGDRTQTLDLSGEISDDSAFEINLDDGDATAELLLDDDDVADEVSATVVRKGRGRPEPGSLSAAFELDDGAEVEDLEISQDLDATIDDTVETLDSEEEEVFDASDETFGAEEVEAVDDEDDYLEPAAKSKKSKGPREPSWGAGMAIGLIACSLFLAANSLVIWAGVSTMWNGADVEGPAGSLIQTFGDLIKS